MSGGYYTHNLVKKYWHSNDFFLIKQCENKIKQKCVMGVANYLFKESIKC